MKRLITGVLVLVALATTATVLTGCTDKAAEISAQAALEHQRNMDALAAAEQSHRHFMETMPIILIVAGGIILLILLVLFFWWMWREQSIRQQQQMMIMMGQQPQLPAPQNYYPSIQVRGPMPAGLLQNVRDKPVVIIHQD